MSFKLDTVRKLLAKAESTTNEHERDALNAKAAQLIAEHGIDAALAAQKPGAPRAAISSRFVFVPAPYNLDKATLLIVIAQACRLQTVRRTKPEADGSIRVHLFGYEADLERVEVLFTSLLVQASYWLARVRPEQGGGGYRYSTSRGTFVRTTESVAAYRRGWLAGFTEVIGKRLLEAERDAAEATGPGTDLVLADRSAAVKAAVAEEYPRLGRAAPRRLSSRSGYQSGQAAGLMADLGGTRIGGGSTSRSLTS